MVARLAGNQLEDARDWVMYRAMLVRLGYSQEEQAAMDPQRTQTVLRQILLDPTRTNDVREALAR